MQSINAFILIVFTFLHISRGNSQDGCVNIMTYNIRYDEKKDSADNWHFRKAPMIRMLEHYNPGLLGIQEGLYHQIAYLDSNLMHHTYIGSGRDDGQNKGEFSAIFIDTTKFRIIKSGTFWLSATPEVPSVGWDAALPRVCTFGLVKQRTSGKLLWVFNTHFDHKGTQARQNSALLLIKTIQNMNADKYPVILMGDFNSEPVETAYKILEDAYQDVRLATATPFYGSEGTFNGFGKENLSRRIDYIFAKDMNVLTASHIDDRSMSGRWISDHIPVLSCCKFIKSSKKIKRSTRKP